MKARKKAQNQLVFTGIKLTSCAIFKQCNPFTQQKYNMPADSISHYQSTNFLKERKSTYCRKSRCLLKPAKITFAEKVSKWHSFMGGNGVNSRISGKEITILQNVNKVLTQTCRTTQLQMQLYQNKVFFPEQGRKD